MSPICENGRADLADLAFERRMITVVSRSESGRSKATERQNYALAYDFGSRSRWLRGRSLNGPHKRGKYKVCREKLKFVAARFVAHRSSTHCTGAANVARILLRRNMRVRDQRQHDQHRGQPTCVLT